MSASFHSIVSVKPGRELYRFKVCVIRLWSVFSTTIPYQLSSLEMILMDEKGSKIRASVCCRLISLFRSKIAEGNVYKMSFFNVFPESGLYRLTYHPYKLIFEKKTIVELCESSAIDRFGLSFTSIGDICAYGPNHDFLVDVVAVITNIFPQREYFHEGEITNMIILELSDNSGKCECALFGSYAEDIQRMLLKNSDGLLVFIAQFVKIEIFHGKVSLQNVLNATRIFVNPSMPKIVSFMEGLAMDGFESDISMLPIEKPVNVSLEDDFLVNFPKASILSLAGTAEDGIYITIGVVDGLVDSHDWWYQSCMCHKSVSADLGAYFCKLCNQVVFKMVPRFRVSLRVDDGTFKAIFVIFDSDMNTLIGKSCSELVGLAKGQKISYRPPELEFLKGKKILFKVEKNSSPYSGFDGSFKVKRICTDVSILDAFEEFVANESLGYHHFFALDDELIDDIQFSTGAQLSELVNMDDDSYNELEFDVSYPHKTLLDFLHTLEDGLFVLCVTIVGLFKIDHWVSPVCQCGNVLEVGTGSYYCVCCRHTVFPPTSKCHFQIAVRDCTSAALFPMSYNILGGLEVVDVNGSLSAFLSFDGEKVLNDMEVLIILKKTQRVDDLSHDVVEIIQMTDSDELIEKFKLDNNVSPPTNIL